MSAGITRVHGYAVMPSQRPSTLTFYQLTLTGVNATSEATVVNGVFDQIFRTAADYFATIAMIGTPVYAASNTTVNFAVEDTGVDTNSPTGLGLGSSEGSSYSTTALALTAAIQALGTINGYNLASVASVAAGVNGAAF